MLPPLPPRDRVPFLVSLLPLLDDETASLPSPPLVGPSASSMTILGSSSIDPNGADEKRGDSRCKDAVEVVTCPGLYV